MSVLESDLPVPRLQKTVDPTVKWKDSTVANSLIEFWEYRNRLHLHKDIQDPDINNLQIIVSHEWVNHKIKIPVNDKTRIMKYLISGELKNVNCKEFIYKTKWVDTQLDIKDWWKSKVKSEDKLVAGECIAMFEYFGERWQSSTVRHYAYYLGGGLYLSKYWPCWAISVATLAEMHQFYWTKKFMSLVPNIWY